MSITKLNYSQKMKENLKEMENELIEPIRTSDREKTEVYREGYNAVHHTTGENDFESIYKYNGIAGIFSEDISDNRYPDDRVLVFSNDSGNILIGVNEDNTLCCVTAKIGNDEIHVRNDRDCTSIFNLEEGNRHKYNGLEYKESSFIKKVSDEGIYIDTEKGETIYGPMNNNYDVSFDELQRPITIVDNTNEPKIIESFKYED